MKMAPLLAQRAVRHPICLETMFASGEGSVPVTLLNVTHDGFMATGEGAMRRGQIGFLMLPTASS